MKEIGGYFSFELNKNYNIPDNAILLNSARNSLRYIIQSFGIKTIHIPFYTCPVVWNSIQKEDCSINFYHIDNNFMPIGDFNENDFILYTNYFGVCAKNVRELAKKYKNLIVDNAQAFYMPKYGIASFNSVRKFFGTPDGSILFSDKTIDKELAQSVSYNKLTHLGKRIDLDASSGYSDFRNSEGTLVDAEVEKMSKLSVSLLENCNVDKAKEQRIKNFSILARKLNKTNELHISLDNDDVPMVYPYLIKDDSLKNKLIQNKIYVATYWNPLPEEYKEGVFQKYLLPLPIDQRYDEDDMNRILDIICK